MRTLFLALALSLLPVALASPAAAQVSLNLNDPAVVPLAETPFAVQVGSSGAVISATNNSTQITLTTAPTTGGFTVGDLITGINMPLNTHIAALASGTANTAGAVYQLDQAWTSGSATGVSVTTGGVRTLAAQNPNRRSIRAYNNQAGQCWSSFVGTPSATGVSAGDRPLQPGLQDVGQPGVVDTGAWLVNCPFGAGGYIVGGTR